MNLIEQINRIERLDQLIRLKATGSPRQLTKKLNISKSTLYNLLHFIKNQGVEIYYCPFKRSFCYKQDVRFYFGFYAGKKQLKKIRGGKHYFFQDFSRNPKFLDCRNASLLYQR